MIISFRVCRAVTACPDVYGEVDDEINEGTQPERILRESVPGCVFYGRHIPSDSYPDI